MSYASSSPSSLLADKNWRLRHSAWMLALFLGCGFLSFVGFLYCAIRVRTKKWWKIAAITGALSALGWLLMSLFSETSEDSGSSDVPGPWDDIAVGYVLALWVGLIIYGFVVNRDYLRWRAGETGSNAWYTQSANAAPATSFAPVPVQQPPVQAAPVLQPPSAPVLGVDASEYFAPPANAQPVATPAPSPVVSAGASGPVDVNVADAGTIASVIGLDTATAARIVSVRDQRRGYQGVDDLVAAAGLQPHELLKLRGKVSFGAYTSNASPSSAPAPQGPTPPVDPGNGRILDY